MSTTLDYNVEVIETILHMHNTDKSEIYEYMQHKTRNKNTIYDFPP